MLLGAHVSTAGGMPNAVRQGLELGCEAIQVFTRNQRQWQPRALDEDEIRTFRREGRAAGYLAHAVSHASYLINLCATDRRTLVRSRRVGVCLDTCHLFAAGYDLRTRRAYRRTMQEVEKTVGIERVHAFHLNDSRHPCGSRRDRHQHIGEGEIGRTAFRHLVNDERFAALPGLLETPGGPAEYARNLRNLDRLRRMRTQI